MKDKHRSALLLGATGLVGGCLLHQLLTSGLYQQVYTVSRSPIGFEHTLLTSKVIDFDGLDDAVTELMGDDVYCCLGTTIKQAGSKEAFRRVDFEYPSRIATIARGRAEHFLLVSALGANHQSRFFYPRVKGELEQALLALQFPFTTIARPSLLIGERKNSRVLEYIGIKAVRALEPLLTGPLKNYAGVEAAKVASVLLGQASLVASGQRSQATLILESGKLKEPVTLSG